MSSMNKPQEQLTALNFVRVAYEKIEGKTLDEEWKEILETDGEILMAITESMESYSSQKTALLEEENKKLREALAALTYKDNHTGRIMTSMHGDNEVPECVYEVLKNPKP